MTGRLFTRDGGFVTDFEMPAFLITPEVAVWGDRLFVLRAPFLQTPEVPARPEYYEACAWSVDASKRFVEAHGEELAGEAMRELERNFQSAALLPDHRNTN